MPNEVLMPRLADTLVEGTVARWLKAANDVVQAGAERLQLRRRGGRAVQAQEH